MIDELRDIPVTARRRPRELVSVDRGEHVACLVQRAGEYDDGLGGSIHGSSSLTR
jgi:hypothetical protein